MHEAAECGPLGHPVRTPPVVGLGGPSYPVRPHLRRQGLREPLRICCAEEAQVLVASLWRADVPASPAARAVDRYPGPGPDRPADLGRRPGPTGPQRGHVLPPQQKARLPSSLLAQVWLVWARDPRLLLSRTWRPDWKALLSLRRDRSPDDGPRDEVYPSLHRGGRPGAIRLGPCRRVTRRPRSAGGAVRAVCGADRHWHPGECGLPPAAGAGGSSEPGRPPPAGSLPS